MLKDIYLEGLRFVYSNGSISVYNAEASHNKIHSYVIALDTQQDFEMEVTYWLREWQPTK